MKYDFFSDFDRNYGLDCSAIYSKLFKGVKFVPKTWCIISSYDDKKEYVRVNVKDHNDKKNTIYLYGRIFRVFQNSYHIGEMYFRYNNEYFLISDIHIDNEGISFKYAVYNLEKVTEEWNITKVPLPNPTEFKNNNITPIFEGTENIPNYFTRNVMEYIIQKYNIETSLGEKESSSRVRIQDEK